MSEQTKTYEGMFLLPASAGDFETASEPVRTILARNQAEVLLLKAWDERRLAYDIGGHRKGLYCLSFFNIDPARVVEIEHDCQLDERILRVLILRRDKITSEEIERERNSTVRPSAQEAESRYNDGDRRRGRFHRDEPREGERSAANVAPPADSESPAEESGDEGNQEG